VVTVAVLGGVEVNRDGQCIPVRPGKTAQVLVRLALDAGVLVGTDRLIEDLWADEAVGTARNTLQTKVSRLRRALGDASLVMGTSTGYTLNVAPQAVDALEVLRLAGVGAARRSAGNSAGSLEACAAGLAMFRGDILPGAGDGDWVIPHRARLEDARLRMIEDEVAARLDLGPPGHVTGELEALVVLHPLREGLWALLMTALYRAGRQADALATYERVRKQLADDLGLDPGTALQQVFEQVLTHDAALDTLGSPDPSPSRNWRTGNLPSMSVDLVGRGREIADLTALLGRARLVQVIGPGGVGKTAAALAVGRALQASNQAARDGVWLARLETAVTANDVVDTLIAALGLPGGEAALLDRLADAEMLVILDNCEHVHDAVALLAERLLDAAPGLRILATSQVALDIDGGVVVELAPLLLSDAVELFRRRAAVQRPNTAASQDDMDDLCRALDGLPLAIELAAARTRTLSVEEISRRLDDRFSLLTDPTSGRPERRRSLRSTIRWSYDLLFPDDQRGLGALATFAGGASMPAVESVLQALDVPKAAALDVVSRLASRSLVIVDDEPRAAARAGSPLRYRLLDSIRAFALEALADADLSESAHAAHAAWIAHAADSSTEGVRGNQQGEHLSLAATERPNIDAALAWSVTHDPLTALRIVRGFGWAWVVLGDSRGADRIRAALEATAGKADPNEQADALLLAAWIEASSGDLHVAREHIALASALSDQLGDVGLQARCCYYLAYVASHHGEFRYAMELAEQSRVLYEELDRPWDQAAAGLFAARAATSAMDEPRTVEALDRVEVWLRRVEDPWLHVRYEAARGELARLQHRFADAVLHLSRAAETSRELGFQQTEAYQVSSLGRAQCQAGDYDTGAATLQRAIDKAEATGDPRLAALIRVHLGRVLRTLGDTARARATLEVATAWHRAAGGGEQAALGECLLAALDASDRVDGSQARLESVLQVARRNDDAPVEVFALDALACLAAAAGHEDLAHRLRTQADGRMAAASHFITERDRDRADVAR
jgi:predicted ATPase/DNA-binding SARP family transcriptional activator